MAWNYLPPYSQGHVPTSRASIGRATSAEHVRVTLLVHSQDVKRVLANIGTLQSLARLTSHHHANSVPRMVDNVPSWSDPRRRGGQMRRAMGI